MVVLLGRRALLAPQYHQDREAVQGLALVQPPGFALHRASGMRIGRAI